MLHLVIRNCHLHFQLHRMPPSCVAMTVHHTCCRLIEMGLEKLVSTLDAKEAASQGLYQRPLTAVNIEKHLGDLGLEAEFASHSMIRGLSGGQRIKLVLAAATWQVSKMPATSDKMLGDTQFVNTCCCPGICTGLY